MVTVILIGDNGQKIGEIDYKEAKKIAQEQGKDLILISKKGLKDVYKMGDAGKLKYEQKQKKKIQRAKQRSQKIKEVQVRPTIDTHDLETKLRHVREFLADGIKTKLVMKFKKRQFVYRNYGMQKMKEVVEQLVADGLASVDHEPKFEGQNINVLLAPKV